MSSLLFAYACSKIEKEIPTCSSNTLEKLDLGIYQKILHLIHNFLLENHHDTTWEQNDSGFVRLDIPDNLLDKPEKLKHNIAKMRLNFWPNNEPEEINEDTLHTHPRYFESYLVHGQYNHRVYAEDKNNISYPYNKFQMVRLPEKEVKAVLETTTGLERIHEKTIRQGDIVALPKCMIHKLLLTYPKTLSLNIVFKNQDETGKDDKTTFHVYRSLFGGKTVDIKRKLISKEDSTDISKQTAKLIGKNIDDNTALTCSDLAPKKCPPC